MIQSNRRSAAPIPVLAVLLALSAGVVRADEALLRNGRTLNVSSFRVEGERIVLMMDGGGEIALPHSQVLMIRRAAGAPSGDVPRGSEPGAPGGDPKGATPAPPAIPPVQLTLEVDGPLQVAPGDVFDRQALRDLAERVAKRHRVDQLLVLAVIEVESRYNAFAVSPRGAMGLMQLMPQTINRFGVRNAFDPVDNVDGGVRYLKELLDRYSGQVRLALAAYNAGEEAVERYGGIPPYRETEQYVARVMRVAGR
ncbi:MAG TPA: lytic transglycosylase domain-containing protein [Candidatus Polarisedimenticolia bacterium]|nr:lytic transglycosylase domain-containing protein [Candidatus Polarisedimenticolia bacterium]